MSPICFSIFWAPEAAPIWEAICFRLRRKELCHVQIKVSRNMRRSPCVGSPRSFEGLGKFGNFSPNTKAPHSTKHELLQSPVGSWVCWKVLNVMCFSVPRGQQFPFFLSWRLCHIRTFCRKYRQEKILLMSVIQPVILRRRYTWTVGFVDQGIKIFSKRQYALLWAKFMYSSFFYPLFFY
jgi:hypothetical protein